MSDSETGAFSDGGVLHVFDMLGIRTRGLLPPHCVKSRREVVVCVGRLVYVFLGAFPGLF